MQLWYSRPIQSLFSAKKKKHFPLSMQREKILRLRKKLIKKRL